jgi:hypothetical protein
MARIQKKREQEEERMKDFIPPKEDVPKKKKRKTEDVEGVEINFIIKERKSDDRTEKVPSKKVRRR